MWNIVKLLESPISCLPNLADACRQGGSPKSTHSRSPTIDRSGFCNFCLQLHSRIYKIFQDPTRSYKINQDHTSFIKFSFSYWNYLKLIQPCRISSTLVSCNCSFICYVFSMPGFSSPFCWNSLEARMVWENLGWAWPTSYAICSLHFYFRDLSGTMMRQQPRKWRPRTRSDNAERV